MVKIAIVEDDDNEADLLLTCLDRYASENNVRFSYERYRYASAFLESKYAPDIVFMDIMLADDMTGMEAAVRLRQNCTRTVLIFVTSMAQFAIKSYEVDALDYIVKPITYERATLKLRKALEVVFANEEQLLVIAQPDGIVQVSANDIYYVEVRGHKLSYHTKSGVYGERGSLNELEAQLKSHDYMRCNACYLVNPVYISSVSGLTVKMKNGDELKISQPKRKAFITDLTNWIGQGKCRNSGA